MPHTDLAETYQWHYRPQSPVRPSWFTEWPGGNRIAVTFNIMHEWESVPRSNAILFVIRCYLIKMEELATIPKWARRFHRVLRDLPPELIDYKGLTRYRPTTIEWLSKFDDGAATSPGIYPD